MSMEEQRMRQEESIRHPTDDATMGEGVVAADTNAPSEEALLERALAMSMETEDGENSPSAAAAAAVDSVPDFSRMTEEEQIIFAMQMSMQDASKFGVEISTNKKLRVKFENIRKMVENIKLRENVFALFSFTFRIFSFFFLSFFPFFPVFFLL